MGAIYIGKKMGAGGFEKQVVLKQLLPEFTSQPEFRDLFLREARLSAALDHANIVHTIDLVNAGEEYFIVMEYVPGADLRTLLKKAKRRRRRFSPAAAIYITREILSALAYAHAKNGPDDTPLRLIHRDVSPSNILISHNGEVKLTDFGIAKASTHNSVFYRVRGKVGYMSPEQARSEELDLRSDLYSVAICFYEMITGERLFVQAGLTTSAEEMYSQPIPMVSRKVKGVPPELDKVVLKALYNEPDLRYQTAGEFQEALLRCAHRAGLMISAPELATHLREVCGATETWRELEGEDGEPHKTSALRDRGTEVYDSFEESTDILDDEEELTSDADLVSFDKSDDLPAPVVDERARRDKRTVTSMFALDRLRNVQLTSMINIAELDAGGAQPLVDLDSLGASSPAVAEPGFSSTSVITSREDDGLLATAAWEAVPSAPGPAPELAAPTYPVAPAAYTKAQQRAAPPQPAPRTRSRALLIVGLILLLGIIAAAVVGLSGPKIEEGDPADLSAPEATDTAEPAGSEPGVAQ